jgi:hypothetical protein
VFGFEKSLKLFALLPLSPKTDLLQVRHTLGFGFPALPRLENPLPFFRLPPRFRPLPAPHNRQVEGSSPSGPTIFHINHRVNYPGGQTLYVLDHNLAMQDSTEIAGKVQLSGDLPGLRDAGAMWHAYQ